MKGRYSHAWLQSFFDETLPAPQEVHAGLLRHAFEVESVESVGTDTVYELDITPDRTVDCLAHYGIAKELSAIFSLSLTRQFFTEPFSFAGSADYIQTEQCDRYTVIHIEDITLSQTPTAVAERLKAIGQRCISPIVDISNYLLFAFGQPIHVFDAAKVSGAFGVRQARDGETLTLISGETVSLLPEDIVVTDTDRPVALAGIKGGEETKVDEHTTSAYIEIATFRGETIRRTARRIRCDSDAALRFSQNIPPEMVGYAATEIASLFAEHGTIVNSADSCRLPLSRERKTGVSVSEVNAVLGTGYHAKDIAGALDRLLFVHEYQDPREVFLQTVRSQIGKPYRWGASVSRNAPDTFDCSSLVCWSAAQAGKSIPRMSINQYISAVPVTEPQVGDLVFSHSRDTAIPLHTESQYEDGFPVSPGTADRGINHVAVLTTSDTIIEAVGSSGTDTVTEAPFEKERMVYAASLWDGEKRFIVSIPVERPDIRTGIDLIEEIGRILGYDAVPSSPPSPAAVRPKTDPTLAQSFAVIEILTKLGFSEVITYSFRNHGSMSVARPVARDKGYLRTDLAGGMREALESNAYAGELLGLSEVRIMEIGAVFTDAGEVLHLALGVRETLGRPKIDISALEDTIRRLLSLPGGFKDGVWEVPLSAVGISPESYQLPVKSGEVRYTPPSPYPFVLRDIAVFVPDGVSADETERVLRDAGEPLLRRINLFDTFTKDARTSYAFRLVFQSDTQTLDDASVHEQMEKINHALIRSGYTVR